MLTPKRKASRWVIWILAVSVWSALGLNSWLTDHYEKKCPQETDIQAGFIYPLNKHGSIVYLNLAEYRTMQAIWAYLGGSVLGGFAYAIWLSREPKVKG
jgi:hypothetical protein